MSTIHLFCLAYVPQTSILSMHMCVMYLLCQAHVPELSILSAHVPDFPRASNTDDCDCEIEVTMTPACIAKPAQSACNPTAHCFVWLSLSPLPPCVIKAHVFDIIHVAWQQLHAAPVIILFLCWNVAVASLKHAAKPIGMQRWQKWAALQTSAMFVCLLKLRVNPTCRTSDCNEQDGCNMRLVESACLDTALLSLQLHIHSSRCEADAGREEG